MPDKPFLIILFIILLLVPLTSIARHARMEYTEDKLKMMLELGVPVAGVKLEKNKLVACGGVEIISNEEEVKEGA